MEKMTNKIALGFVLGLEEVKNNKEVFEKLQKMLEQVEKKSSTGANKLTKTQEENEKIKEVILEVLRTKDQPQQIKELLADEKLREYTNQKMSALLKQLVECGKVEKVVEKRISKFKIK